MNNHNTTFSDISIPFPLFEAPIADAKEYVGKSTCSLCNTKEAHCFKLDIGADIIVSCPKCSNKVALDADYQRDTKCNSCGEEIKFPNFDNNKNIVVCYECLRKGYAALTKDTELGMITHETAMSGITHGVPGLNRPEFETVSLDDDWVGVKLSKDIMFELLRTPGYHSWQGEQWLFCCNYPMTYLGEWTMADLMIRVKLN